MTSTATPTLAQYATENGVGVPCAGNLPLDLGDPQFAWFIESGAVDVFLVERQDGGADQSAPQHLLRAGAGRLLPGSAPAQEDTTLKLIAKGLPGTLLRRLPTADLDALQPAELATEVDSWIMDLSAQVSRDVAQQPRPDLLIERAQAATTMTGRLSTRHGVTWLLEPPQGAGLFMELLDPTGSKADNGNGAGALPLTPLSWLTLMEPARLATCTSETLAGKKLLLPALADFHALVFAVERINRSLAIIDQANLETERLGNRQSDEEDARRQLFNLYGLLQETGAGAQDVALIEALKLIGEHEGIDFKQPARTSATDDADALIGGILNASGVRWRRVRLVEEDNWWAGDSGALLAFREEDGQPVALLPGALGYYREVDPLSRRATRVTAKRAAQFQPRAWQFYPTLGCVKAGSRDLLRVAGKGLSMDLMSCAGAGLASGLVMLLPAALTGFIAGQVVPTGATGLLYLSAAAIVGFGLLGALLHMLWGATLMRLEGRVTSRLEAALWDRLVRLRSSFLKRYAAGDLAMRGEAFQQLRDTLRTVATNALLSIVFLIPALLLIFFYDAALGGVCTGFTLLSLAITVTLGVRQTKPQGRTIRIMQRLSGRLNQLIGGIAKLRVAGAEGSAFAVWARDYHEQKRAEMQAGAKASHLQAFCAALPLLAGAALLLAVTLPAREAIPVGEFVAVFILFMLLQTVVKRLGDSFSVIATIAPTLEQVQPFFHEVPELDVEGEPVGTLRGNILFDHVSFRYDPEGPLILDDVSLDVRSGEFIAIVGESGSGKSTLFRLALGLEQPATGVVYYDGRDLRHLNIKQVRRQVGVVPQAIHLFPQDLWDNIAGNNENITSEDAWKATRFASVDREIEAMPMKMLTPVSGKLISGGEAQRVLIAHALVHNPRILLLDEATNWLDNENQAKIMHNVGRLSSTRIVIAHRISTLRQADRIYVMQAGKVVQQGSFTELAASEGLFQDLVRRQTA